MLKISLSKARILLIVWITFSFVKGYLQWLFVDPSNLSVNEHLPSLLDGILFFPFIILFWLYYFPLSVFPIGDSNHGAWMVITPPVNMAGQVIILSLIYATFVYAVLRVPSPQKVNRLFGRFLTGFISACLIWDVGAWCYEVAVNVQNAPKVMAQKAAIAECQKYPNPVEEQCLEECGKQLPDRFSANWSAESNNKQWLTCSAPCTTARIKAEQECLKHTGLPEYQ